MKVLVISDYRPYHSARPESSIFVGLAKKGVDIAVMTYKEGNLVAEMEAAGIKIIGFHPDKKYDKAAVARIREYIIEHKIDILHLFNNKSIINGIKAAKGLDVKVILYRGYAGNLDWYDPTAYIKHLHSRVDYIHCNSIGVEQYMRRQLFKNKDKAFTVNKGHNTDWYTGYEARDIRKELGLPADAFLLINVANNRRMKGIPYLLEAFNLLPKDWNIHLLMAGDRLDTPDNRAIVAKGGSTEKVHFLGFQQKVLEVVAACDVFVLASLYGESITKSVIEAMSLGVAPVITDIPGNIELVEDGVSGLVVPAKNPQAMAEAIAQLYTDRAMHRQMCTGATNHIKVNLNEQKTVDEIYTFYQKITEDV